MALKQVQGGLGWLFGDVVASTSAKVPSETGCVLGGIAGSGRKRVLRQVTDPEAKEGEELRPETSFHPGETPDAEQLKKRAKSVAAHRGEKAQLSAKGEGGNDLPSKQLKVRIYNTHKRRGGRAKGNGRHNFVFTEVDAQSTTTSKYFQYRKMVCDVCVLIPISEYSNRAPSSCVANVFLQRSTT